MATSPSGLPVSLPGGRCRCPRCWVAGCRASRGRSEVNAVAEAVDQLLSRCLAEAISREVQRFETAQVRGGGEGLCPRVGQPAALEVECFQTPAAGRANQNLHATVAQLVVEQAEVHQTVQAG